MVTSQKFLLHNVVKAISIKWALKSHNGTLVCVSTIYWPFIFLEMYVLYLIQCKKTNEKKSIALVLFLLVYTNLTVVMISLTCVHFLVWHFQWTQFSKHLNFLIIVIKYYKKNLVAQAEGSIFGSVHHSLKISNFHLMSLTLWVLIRIHKYVVNKARQLSPNIPLKSNFGNTLSKTAVYKCLENVFVSIWSATSANCIWFGILEHDR